MAGIESTQRVPGGCRHNGGGNEMNTRTLSTPRGVLLIQAVALAVLTLAVAFGPLADPTLAQGDDLRVTKSKERGAGFDAVVFDGTDVGTSLLGNTHIINGGASFNSQFGSGGGAFIQNFDCADDQDPFAPPDVPEACTNLGGIDIAGPNVKLRISKDLSTARITGKAFINVNGTEADLGESITLDLTLTGVGDLIKGVLKDTKEQGPYKDIFIARYKERDAMVTGTIGEMSIEDGVGFFGKANLTDKTNRPQDAPPDLTAARSWTDSRLGG